MVKIIPLGGSILVLAMTLTASCRRDPKFLGPIEDVARISQISSGGYEIEIRYQSIARPHNAIFSAAKPFTVSQWIYVPKRTGRFYSTEIVMTMQKGVKDGPGVASLKGGYIELLPSTMHVAVRPESADQPLDSVPLNGDYKLISP